MARAQSLPEVGLWYRDIQNRLFEVVAIDNDDAIEVQYYDGDVSELDQETWELLCVNAVSEPGDGLGMYDDDTALDEIDNDLLHTVSWDSVIADTDG